MRSAAAPVVTVVPVSGLSDAVLDEIWDLASSLMDTSRAVFEATLRAKEQCFLARDPSSGRLLGLGAFRVRWVEFGGRRERVIFAGNALFREEARGNNVIQRLGTVTWLAERLRHPTARIWLFYDTFSFKSYLMLPRNLTSYWPRRDRETPSWEAGFRDHLGQLHFGDAWDPERGVVRVTARRRLRSEVARIDDRLLQDPDVRYFADANPRYDEGETLAILAPLDLANWVAVGRNLLRRSRRGAARPTPSIAVTA